MSWSPVIKDVGQDSGLLNQDGLPGYAREEDKTAAHPTRATLDTGKATGLRATKPKGHIDTTQTAGLTVPYNIFQK